MRPEEPNLDLMFGWVDAVLTARVPATAGATLRAMTEQGGWLGDRSTVVHAF